MLFSKNLRLKQTASILLLLATIPAFSRAQSVESRPNIIFLYTDDQAYDTLGVYGAPQVITPNLDRLGEMGVIFDRHYNTTAICMASRANVMTGLLEYRHGSNFMHGPMARKIWNRSFPMQLRDSGYRTAFAGKFGFAVVNDPEQGGSENTYDNLPIDDFDVWLGGIGQTSYVTSENKYLADYAEKYPHSTRAYGAAGQDFIREAVRMETPFCLTIFFKAPHRPTTPDPMFDAVYEKTEFRKLPNYGRESGEHLAPQSRMGRQYPRFVEWGYHTEATYQRALRTYHQQIYGVDYAIGMLLDELKAQGIADNTVIIFSSDNGFFNGSHGFGSKVLPYEEGARVPFIIYDPRSPDSHRHRRVMTVTGNIDIPATILDLAGIPGSESMDGVSLVPLLQGGTCLNREALPIIQVWGPLATHSLSVVNQRYKYIYWFYGEGMDPVEELFDLESDPFEMVNLAGCSGSSAALESMRNLYDLQRRQWEKNSVPYNHYSNFSKLMDREIPWNKKRSNAPGPWSLEAGR